MKFPKLTQSFALIIIGILIVVVTITAWAIFYQLQTSTPVVGDVVAGTIYVPLSLNANFTGATDLDTVTAIATATGSNAINTLGRTVTFYNGTTPIGTAIIQQSGSTYRAVKDFSNLVAGHYILTAGP